ncbi:hypothetical protein K435DRAFT_685839, partial [Dendrothele bispora CBS 962.96]
LGTFCLLFTNLSTTLLIAYRAWYGFYLDVSKVGPGNYFYIRQYRQFVRQYFAKESLNKIVNKIFLVLVESGMLYCLFWVKKLFLSFFSFFLFS